MIYVRTLGAARIELGSSHLDPTSPRKFALLLYLSSEPGRRVSRDMLHTLVFSDQTAQNARHSLRELVYQLRRLGIPLSSNADGIELPADAVRCDYFEIIERPRPAAAELDAVRRGFLPDYAPPHSEALTEWYEAFRARWIFAICKTLIGEVKRARDVADWRTTEHAALACLGLDPSNEEATLALAEMLAIGGSRAHAMKVLDDYMRNVSSNNEELRSPAAMLKRRIVERVRASHVDRPTSFVGRDDEMLLAVESLGSAGVNGRRSLLIGGEPGIGKTRFASELHNRALLGAPQTKWVAMQPQDARYPLGVFAHLVPQLLALRGAIGCSPSSLQVLRRLTDQAGDPFPKRPEELELISTAVIAAIHDLFGAIASETGLAVFIDDAHWLDPLSLQTLIDLASTRDELRLLIVLITRDHRRISQQFEHGDSLRVVQLRRMSDAALALMVDELLARAGRQVGPDARGEIVARSAGNPLFAILSAADFASDRNGARPVSLSDLLVRRLDVLAEHPRSALLACVALGRHCSMARLLKMLELPHSALVAALTRLTDDGLVVSDGETLATGHPLISEIIRERADLVVVRAAFHRAAEVIELDAKAYGSVSLYWDSADRWLVATNYRRAFAAFRECAMHALALGQGRDAVTILQRACALAVPNEDLRNAERELVLAATVAGDAKTALTAAQRAYGLGLAQCHDEVEHAVTHATFTLFDAAPEIAERLVACTEAAHATPEHRVWAATWLIKVANVLGRSDLEKIARTTVDNEDCRTIPKRLLLEFELVYCSTVHDHRGAIAAANAMARLVSDLPAPLWLAPQFNIGLALWFAGETEEAIRVQTAAFDVAVRIGANNQQLQIASTLASIYFDLRDDSAGIQWMNRAQSLIATDPDARPTFNLLTCDFEVAISRGEAQRARTLFERLVTSGAFTGAAQRQRWHEAGRLLLAASEREITEEDEIAARILVANQKSAMSSTDDIEIAAACEALRQRRKPHDARTIMSSYLERNRRWRNPPSRSTQVAAEHLGIDWKTRWCGAS